MKRKTALVTDQKALLHFDYQATTPCDPEVVDAMQPYWCDYWGNASSLHHIGVQALWMQVGASILVVMVQDVTDGNMRDSLIFTMIKYNVHYMNELIK